MLKKFFGKLFVQVYRTLFVAAFIALNLVGISFLGVIGFYLVF